MNQLSFPLLSLVLWLPAIGGLVILLLPNARVGQQRAIAFGAALLTLLAALPLYFAFDSSTPAFQFTDSVQWIASLGVSYSVSVDGISVWLVLMTVFLTPVALAATWGQDIPNFRTFQSLLLLLETATIGVFVAQDLFLFYLFFELTLVPTALLIGIWGGAERVRAATKFFVYTFSGSLFLLLGIIGIYLLHGAATNIYTFDFPTIRQSVATNQLALSTSASRLLFGAFFLAFAVKAPLWPFHTWLPQAHEQASNDGSVDILGLLIKTGAYGMLRFNVQLFPEAARWAAPAIGVLAVISILYGAWVAFAQTDMKRLLGFSSVSHVGFIVLGIFALNQLGASGATLQIVNVGIASGALFLIVGMIAARTGTRSVNGVSGLWKATPIFGSLTLAVVFASVGLPGLNSFPGEYAIMQGTWVSQALGWRFMVFAVIGTILAAVYLLRMYRLAFMGDAAEGSLPDLSRRELSMLITLLVPIILIGLYPNIVFGPMQAALQQVTSALALR